MKLITGLGNPGLDYCLTRHNIGFLAADRIAAETEIILHASNFNALIGLGVWCGYEVVLAKPLTFMNLSGEAVHAISTYYGIAAADIIILHDDLDFPLGTVRIKVNGGSGGHRGIKSITAQLSTDCYTRLRIGIGRPSNTYAAPDYVLEPFSFVELGILPAITGNIFQCIEMMFHDGIPAAMKKYHTANASYNRIGTNLQNE